MQKYKKPYLVGIAVVVLVLAGLFWIKHDADAKASNYMTQRDALRADYKKEVTKLNLSTLVHADDTDLAPKQRAVCNQAVALQQKLTTSASPNASIFGLGGVLSSKYSSAEHAAASAKNSTQQVIDALHKYDAICTYYVTDNEYSQRYDAIGKSAEYKAQLSFNPPACNNDTGCIYQDHYASFAPIYEKKIQVIKDRNAAFKNIACPFTAADQKSLCDKIAQVRAAMEKGDQEYVAALRAGDTAKIGLLAGKESEVAKAVNDMDTYARKLDPTLSGTDRATQYFSHQIAALEKQLQSITI